MKHLWEKRNGMAKGFLALAAFLAVVFWNPLTVRAYIQTQGTVVSDSAVIRQTADANSNVIASIVKGDTVTINNEETDSSGNVWYKIFVDANTLGYVRGDLIQKSGDSAPVSNPVTTATTTTVTNTETLSAPGDSAAGTDTGSEVNTNLTVGVNTAVTPIQSQGASVGSDNVRVRADASTNASIVTKVGQSTAITLTGQATGDDGKLWFQVSFIADGSEVTGFIREDFVQRTEEIVILDQQPAEDDPMAALPEEPTDDVTPEESTYNADYELKFEPEGEGGEYEWFLHNNMENKRTRLNEILNAAEGNTEAIETANAQLKRDKIIIIILAIVLVFLALTVTLLLFRLRDTYYDDFDEYDDDQDEPVRRTDRAPRTVKPVQGERPAPRPSGGQERSAGGQRPAGNGQRPSGNGQNRPANAGQRPAGSSQNRPANAGQRPSGNGQNRPAGSGQNRPAGQNQRPAGNGQSRPANAQSRPAGQGQARPSSGSRPAKQDAGWKAKNFMTEDDDLEFEFLNWDGEER